MKFQHIIVVALCLMWLSGCIAPAGPENLRTTIQLADVTFQDLGNVSGVVEVKNVGERTAVGPIHAACCSFTIQRMSDGATFHVQHLVFNDPSFQDLSFGPGETIEQTFSFADPSYDGAWEYQPKEFPRGQYGLSTRIVRDGEWSDLALFEILEDA